MKREILFKGKCLKTKEWVYGYYNYCKINDVHKIISEQHGCIGVKVEKETIGQFTGLLDKYGNKIFEDDVLKGGIYSRYEIEWDSYNCEFNIHAFNVDLFEIIGNIHDNEK